MTQTTTQTPVGTKSRWVGLLGMAFVGAVLTVTASAVKAQDLQAALVRPGEWAPSGASYVLPPALANHPSQWPTDGWYRVTHKVGQLEVHAVPAPERGLPGFLSDIAAQTTGADNYAPGGEAQAEAIDTEYRRVPGVALETGRLPLVNFANQVLHPKLDHEYTLTLGEQNFSLTVHNGLRNKNGVPYGQGAQYVLSYDGQTFSYLLGEQGWNSVVRAVADLDGDGKPDLIVQVPGYTGMQEFVLLSSQAKPGPNAPTASLTFSQTDTEPGC